MFICVNLWLMLFLATDYYTDFTDFINPIASMFSADFHNLPEPLPESHVSGLFGLAAAVT